MENQNFTPEKNTSVVSIGEWVVTMLLMYIPIVNLIMLFVWAFSSDTPESKANWAKVVLIFSLIGIILLILVLLVAGFAFFQVESKSYNM